MRILLDTCVWLGARATLESAGHDVEAVGELPEDPGDEAVLAWAQRENRVLVTLDKDFGELAIVRQQPHGGIIRLVDIPARQHGARCVEVLERYGSELDAGAIVTAERGRTRIRPKHGESPR